MESEGGTFSHKLCRSCDIVVDEPSLQFKCMTCPDENDKTEIKSASVFCNLCIACHTRKSHEVKDSKGNAVIVCDKHKLLIESFCLKCCKTLCNRCTKEHLNQEHTISSLEGKAMEIKKSIHEELGKIDECYKPVALAADTIKEHCSKFEEFRASYEPDTLSANLQKMMGEIINDSVKASENQNQVLGTRIKIKYLEKCRTFWQNPVKRYIPKYKSWNLSKLS